MSIRRTDLLIDVGRMLFGCLCTVIDVQVFRINNTQLFLPLCMFLLCKFCLCVQFQCFTGLCRDVQTARLFRSRGCAGKLGVESGSENP